MAKTKQVFTGDASQLQREYQKLLAQQTKLEEDLRKVKRTANEAGKAQKNGMSAASKGANRLVGDLAGVITGYFSVQGALQLVNAELEKKKRLEKGARDASIRIADAEAKVTKNIGTNVTTPELQAFIDQVADIQKDTGFQSTAPLLESAANILSATGGDQKKTLDIVSSLAPLFRDSQDDLALAASAAGDIMQASGRSAKETAGVVLAIQGQARIETLAAFSQVAPAIKAAVNTQKNIDRGQAVREAGAAFATIGNLSADKEGAITKGAVSALAAALERNFSIDESKFARLTSEGTSIEEARKQSALSFAQRLDLAQASGDRITAAINRGEEPAEKDLKIRDDILKTGFRETTRSVVRNLISGNETTGAVAFDKILKEIKFDTSIVDRKTEQLQSGTQNMRIAANARKLEGDIERSQLSGSLGTVGAIRNQFESALENTGTSFFGSTVGTSFAKMRFEMAADNTVASKADIAVEQLQERIGDIRGEPLFYADKEDRERKIQSGLTDLERQEIQLLRSAITNIERLAKGFEANQQPAVSAPPAGNAAQQARMHDERD